mgnify:CR=1 FL=1
MYGKNRRSINEDFDQLLSNIENGILNSSISATLEEASDFKVGLRVVAFVFLNVTAMLEETE